VPYGLYSASVLVQGCTLPLPIPLFPLRSVRLVQSLSACTTVHFTFTYTSTPPMCRTACTEPQSLYKGAPIPLFPLCAVRPVQSLSACTTLHFTFNYTSTPPMCRTPCTEPQCLHNGAVYLYLYLYSPMCRKTCIEPQCLCNGAIYLYIYLYSPYVLYALYRASVLAQRCSLPLSIPLFPLCAVLSVQNLSACTTVHFTLPLKLSTYSVSIRTLTILYFLP